ncbi:phosphoadenylyl-sulfate reductase [Aquabacter spiritensis]|uniref:Adenosine 5'-phosphosulfate reductase n=1 Tax=Aquabacter spiritensis TaxID=933073 RepID=A0A4R3M5A1_9HYPH|nr:phosphoadenylyl-sulfate reductase [Aquabacter spiritensis]TCT08202.1 phosphoadenylylsulfate reductase (thioredoxin) [Aquabacter spiritensis]
MGFQHAGRPPAESDLPRIAAALDARLHAASPLEILSVAAETERGRIAAVSSFGVESAVMLHMMALVDAAIPVIFLDTGHLFAETLAYRDTLVDRLGLRDVRTITPDAADLSIGDPEAALWAQDPDACCRLRKVAPLAGALTPFAAWINGRKRYQAATRTRIPVVEADGHRLKFNPLAALGPAEIAGWMKAHRLPAHPLQRFGFPSVGCMPCTSRVTTGEDPRAGRWRGRAKTECGIHVRAVDGAPPSDPQPPETSAPS